jgi:hypothetical protein
MFGRVKQVQETSADNHHLRTGWLFKMICLRCRIKMPGSYVAFRASALCAIIFMRFKWNVGRCVPTNRRCLKVQIHRATGRTGLLFAR